MLVVGEEKYNVCEGLPPGGVLGSVREGPFLHKVMVPFNEPRPVEVTWIREGNVGVEESVARVKGADGLERSLTMTQRWPVRRPIPEGLLRRRFAERLYPSEPLTTATRIIDTFFPIARGGTACIPGPFGAGKTVLQSTLARYATVDIVIIVACGERAGEVVETITLYPETQETEECLLQHHGRHRQGGIHDDGPKGIGQHVPHEEA